MNRRIAALAVALAALTLTGCAGDPSSVPENTEQPTATRNLPVTGSDGLVETKPIVDGTELICLRGGYGSTNCNWELWNKQREAKK